MASTPFVTATALGTLRNNFSGTVGWKFTVGAASITVTDLGRWKVAGDTHNRVISIYRHSDQVLMCSATVNNSAGTAAQYNYASCTSTVLAANTVYRICSAEVSGEDQWYDVDNTVLTTTAVATVNNGCYNGGGGFPVNDFGSAGHGYVPVNFQYAVADPVGTITDTGQGVLTAGPTIIPAAISDTGAGTLTVTGGMVSFGSSTVTGNGTLSATGGTIQTSSATITGLGVLQHIITGLRDATITRSSPAQAWPEVNMPIAYVINRNDRSVVVSNQSFGPSGDIEVSGPVQ